MAKVSTSAAEARALGLLTPSDRITLNRERLLLDAKAQAAALAEAGYAAPHAANADSSTGHGGAGHAGDGDLS